MLITKSKPKLKLENDLNKKLHFSIDFCQNFTEHPSMISVTMATVDVPWDWFVLRIQAY